MILEHRYITTFHLKVLLLRSSSFSVCLQVTMFFLHYLRQLFLYVKSDSISTLPSGSLGLCYFLPHVVAVSYNWSLWCARDRGMVRSALVKFFTVTWVTIQNSVSFQSFIHLLTIRLMGILILELLQPSWDQRHY